MFTLTFSEQQMILLNQAISELPHKHAVPLIQAINEQIVAQQEADEPSQNDESQTPSA